MAPEVLIGVGVIIAVFVLVNIGVAWFVSMARGDGGRRKQAAREARQGRPARVLHKRHAT